jgi:hypothetical protein
MNGLFLTLGSIAIFAAKTRDELYEEHAASGRFYENLGYVLAGIGILLVIASIPISIYFDRKKKARKQARKDEARMKGGIDSRRGHAEPPDVEYP